MFGFSPNKLLFTALVIAAVWYGFKWLGRFQADQKKRAKRPPQDTRKSEATQSRSQDADYEELVACRTCGDFVIADKRSGGGKENCPYDK